MNAVEILSLFAPYRDAPVDQRLAMAGDVTTAVLSAGTIAFRTGSPCTSVAIVGAGRIRVTKMDDTGREISLYHVGPGETCLLTLSCALTGDPYPADAIVDETVEAVVVPVERFRQWFEGYRSVRDYVIRTLTGRAVELMTLVEEVAFHDLGSRLARFLHDAALLDDQHRLTITHDLVAAELGSSRETVSRLLKEYERVGLVELHRGSIHVLDPDGLLGHRRSVIPNVAADPTTHCRPASGDAV